MKHPAHLPSFVLAGLLALAAFLCGDRPVSAAQAATSTAAKAPAPEPAPIGAIWVSTAGAWYRDTPRIDLFIEDLRAKPFGEAIIQLVDAQGAYYGSRVLPKATGVPENYDPLQTLLKGLKAGPNPLKLIAWIDPILAGNVNRPQPANSTHVTITHPEWLAVRADGTNTDDDGNMYLELGLLEVRKHLVTVVRELVRDYPIDGIYFDPVADPGADWGYDPSLIETWRQRTGGTGNPEPNDPAWIALRAEVITRAVGELTRAAREIRPSLAIGVGVRTDGPPPADAEAFRKSPIYTTYHQDWAGWLAAPVPVGRIYLKNFKSESGEAGAFDGWMNFALAAAQPSGTPVVVGVAGHMNESILAMGQMRNAVASGAAGVALDNYEKPLRDGDAREPFMNAIRNTVLSAEYMKAMAALSRSSARLAQSGQTTQTQESEPVVPPGAEAQAEPTTATTGDALALPLPPAPGQETVSGSEQAVATATGPDAGRRAVPGDTLGLTTATQGSGEVTIRSQRILPPALAGAGATTPTLAQRMALDPATRRQMLQELVKDPLLNQDSQAGLIQPEDKYKVYLKQRFGNIFD